MKVTMAIDDAALASTLSALESTEDPPRTLETALRQVVDATSQIFAADGAGLMLMDDSQALHYVSATDPRSSALEAAQLRLGYGPCVDSLVHDVLVSTGDLRADDRWPGLADELAATDIVSVLGVPVRVGGAAVGSLNAYRTHSHPWDGSEVQAIAAFARVIEDLIGASLLAKERGELATQLEHALEHRVVIERAVGLIMGERRIDAVAAFDLLRRQARTDRRKVVDLAEDMLQSLR